MRTFIIFLTVCTCTISHAQQWRTFYAPHLGFAYGLTNSDLMAGGRSFRINPYDNSLWMTTQYTIQTIAADGTTNYFRYTNTPVLSVPYYLVSFEFLPDKVFVLDNFKGVYLYENDELSMMYSTSGLFNGIVTDEDTLYILRENNQMVKWTNENLYHLFNTGTRNRIVVKNNHFWLANIFGSIGLYLRDESGNPITYDASKRMDNMNFDHKFSPHHDTLYVAGNKGLSLLHNLAFFDSIAPDNTTNMPAGVILDFEFDASDNIWALFGSDAQTPTAVAHYDQPSKTWDAYYDASNSDLNFSTYCSIEMDTFGNLWMVNTHYIHVLELGELPVWLSAKQPSMQSAVSVYPNPAAEFLYIETDLVISEIHLTDQMGKQVKKLNPKETAYSVAELPSGIYFVELVSEAGEKRTLKVIKE